MKKQIINSHTIKVFITKWDLKRNGITALDLLGDHNQIEAFFYKILNEIDTKHLLTSNEPLTFRVLPNQKGLDIIISNHRKVNPIQKTRKINKPINHRSNLNRKIIQLDSFENFIQISNTFQLDHVKSSLYRYGNKYYLELNFNYNLIHGKIDQVKNQLAVAYEYGRSIQLSRNELELKGKVIMKNHALEQGRYYFR